MILSEERNEQTMPDYEKMYLTLFAATEDVLELLERDKAAFRELLLPARIQALLTQAQQECEDLYAGKDA